jgi:thiol-disulfide isomerase/thioredoxin
MKKFLPALLLMVALSFGATAQTAVYFSEDFSGGMPDDWTILDLDGLTPFQNVAAFGGTWWVSPTAAPEAKAAISSSWYAPAGQSNDWMITPSIDIPMPADPNAKIFLTWYGEAIDPSFPDGYDVRLSTTDRDPASFTEVLIDVPREDADGIYRSVDLSAYAGQTIYLSWINDSNDQYILVIDDILIAEYPALKVSSVANLTQGYNLDSDNINLAASFISEGHANVTSADFNYSVDGGATMTEAISGLDLPLLGIDEISLSNGLSLSAGRHSIDAWLSNINGEAVNSDTLSFDVSVMAEADAQDRRALVEGFTSSSCPPCKDGNENVKNVIASLSPDDRPLVLKLQQNFPGAGDPYCTDELVARRNYYGISSIPNVTINGNFIMKNSNSVIASDFTTAKEVEGYVSLDVEYMLDPDNQSIRVYGSYTTQAEILDDTRLMIAIYETITYDNVSTNGETEFPDVVKKFYPNEMGITIPANTPVNTPVEFDYEYVFQGDYRLPADGQPANRIDHDNEHSVEDFNNLRAAAWIEYPTDLFVLNAYEATEGTISADNLPKVVAGLKTYPNPATEMVTIDLDLAEAANLTIDVLDLKGQMVSNVATNVQGIQGNQNFVWNVGNAPAGNYYVRIRTEKSEVTTKVSVVK